MPEQKLAESVAEAAAIGDGEKRSWGAGWTDRAAEYANKNRVKTAIGLGVATQQLNKRVVDPLIDKGLGLVKGTAKKVFASGAEQKVNESMGGESAANAVGGIVEFASQIGKAFLGVGD